jgi:hypothetical protein
MKNSFLLLILLACSFGYNAQTAEEIINQFQQAIGGEKWNNVTGLRMNANVEQGGMKIPVEVVMLKDGRMYTEITLMGNTMIMQAYDGTTVWTTNFMSMEPEKAPSDEIKLDKKTIMAEGKEVPNIEYYYIDKENNVPILTETEIQTGEMKGKISQTKYSDYQEVDGVIIAFSNTSGIKDGMSQTIQYDKVEVNPKVEETKFSFPKK